MNYVSLIGFSHKECQKNEPLWESHVKILTQWSTFLVYYIKRNDDWLVIHDNSYLCATRNLFINTCLTWAHYVNIYVPLLVPFFNMIMFIRAIVAPLLYEVIYITSRIIYKLTLTNSWCSLNDEQRLMMINHELSDGQSLMKNSLAKQWSNLIENFSTSHEGHGHTN